MHVQMLEIRIIIIINKWILLSLASKHRQRGYRNCLVIFVRPSESFGVKWYTGRLGESIHLRYTWPIVKELTKRVIKSCPVV